MKFPLAARLCLLIAACSSEPAAPTKDAGVPALADAGVPDAPTAIVSCAEGHEPTDPVDFGRCEIARALVAAHSAANVRVATVDDPEVQGAANVDPRPESFSITTIGDTTWILGRDANGALYGALELSERLRLDGAGVLPLAQPVVGAPTVPLRAINPFLVLPDTAEDRSRWWFLDEGFWHTYLDLLAHARINFLDLHGMYDLETTLFPNALLYFARAKSYPDVGVPLGERETNLVMLNKVVGWARARGIRVGLMSYRADTSPTATTGEQLDEAALTTYTREAAADLATRAPGLSWIGFRIGESVRPAQWYRDTIVAGVHQAANGVGVYTRTWIAPKDDILALLAGEPDSTIVEAKFNGEQLGPPYVIAGGAFASLGSYSYQGFLNPPAPYTFVFQVRSGGTHRVFREASYERTRRAVRSLALSPRIQGFTLEPPSAFFPQRDDYHADPADRVSEWTFVRDELMYKLWGRLGYDPDVPERVFRAELGRRAGTTELWDSLQAASDIVPWIQTGHTCGPDARDYAPEMEMGGDVGVWASATLTPSAKDACNRQGPFDTFAVASPADAADDLIAGRPTTRISPLEVARRVLADADQAAAASLVAVAAENITGRDLVREALALADLGRFFAHKLRAATALAVYARSAHAGYLTAARTESTAAATAWNALVAHTVYIRPFAEHLRMRTLGLEPFHWSEEVSRLDADVAAIDAVAATVRSSPPSFTGTLPDPAVWLQTTAPIPLPAQLTVAPQDPSAPAWRVSVTFLTPLPTGARVRVLWKPFVSESEWTSVDTTLTETGSYAAMIAGGGEGALFAAEVETSAETGWRFPAPTSGMPYVSLPP